MSTPACLRAFVASVVLLAAATASADVLTPEVHTISVNGIEMRYEVVGSGDPLVLLHSGTQTARMYDPFVERFAARYRLVIPDLRGHGGSTNPTGQWTVEQFAEDVFGLLDHLGIARFKAIGASAGGMTLLRMATRQPERVEAMIVVGVGTYLPVDCRRILAQTDAGTMSEAGWTRYRELHSRGDDQIRALFAWVASLANDYDDMNFTPALLSTIRARTLVVHGDRDYCFPASMAWDIYRAIPQAYLWVVPNGSHVPISGSRAGSFAEIALEFLAGDWEGK